MNRRLTLSLHDAPTPSRERGEIATILTAIAVVVLTVGVAIGATFIKLPQKNILRSDAQTDTVQNSPLQGSCTYESFTHIYKESEGIFFSPTEIGSMKVVNDRGGALLMDENERSQRHFSIGEFPFDPTRKANYAQNDTASLTLEGYDRQKWKVKSVFCINRGVQGCPDEAFISVLNQRIASGLEDGARIDNFKVNCDVDVTYGWVLTQSPSTLTPAPTITPAPTDQPTPLPTVASCPYTSTSHVYLGSKGTPLALTELGGKPLTVTNNRNNTLQLNQNSVSTNSFTVDPMPFDPTGKDYYQKGAPASVTLGLLPETYKISSVFCDQAPDSARGCPLPEEIARMNAGIAQKSLDGKTIEGFKVDCNVNVTYGWIVEPQKIGLGSMEVRVEALNYPQKTPIWDKDDIASNKPGSCSRQQSGEQRPLYLNSFKIKATCVSGACSGNKSLTIKIDKRTGYANFTGMTPGEYKLDMVDLDDRGYEVWEPCGDAVWKIEDGKTNQLPVMFLVNLKDGEYEEMPTEGLCKDANGYPNLVEGLNGNVCYFKDGKKEDEPKPDPKPEPDPKPGEGCTGLQDGSDGICVIIENRDQNLRSINGVSLVPLPGLYEKNIEFDGNSKMEVIRIQVGIETQLRQVVVNNFVMMNGAKSSQIHVYECVGGIITEDKSNGAAKGSQICTISPSPTARVHYIVVPNDSKPEKPKKVTPTPTPPKKTHLNFTIPLRMKDVNLHNDYVARIKKMRPYSMPFAQKIHAAAIQNNWNPALVLAIWLEETGGSTTTISQAGGAGKGTSKEHLGCNPRKIQQIDQNLSCFFGPPRTDLKNDEFEKFVAGYCGPNQPVLCGNNVYFINVLGHVYDSLVPPGTKGARQFFPTFAGDEVKVSEDLLQIDNILMNDFISQNLSANDDVTIKKTDDYTFGYSKVDAYFYLQLHNKVNVDDIFKSDIYPLLKLSASEVCNLNMFVDPQGFELEKNEKEHGGYIQNFSFCSSPTQQDLNTDDVVNGVDFAQCVADYDTSDEAEKAFDKLTKRETFTLSTGQSLESLYELDLPCDFNVNRRIDALDLSKVIDAIGISASDQE